LTQGGSGTPYFAVLHNTDVWCRFDKPNPVYADLTPTEEKFARGIEKANQDSRLHVPKNPLWQ
jgi:hypothetical protein